MTVERFREIVKEPTKVESIKSKKRREAREPET